MLSLRKFIILSFYGIPFVNFARVYKFCENTSIATSAIKEQNNEDNLIKNIFFTVELTCKTKISPDWETSDLIVGLFWSCTE